MSRALGLAAIAAAAAICAAPASPAAASTRGYRFYAGAGRADITPPLAGTTAGDAADAQFAPALANCPTAAFPAEGRFALQEPFDDLNGDGQWDAGTDLSTGPTGQKPDPFCDANANGRWDGIYSDNELGPIKGINDPVDVRAVAISDGRHPPLVYASVDVIGLFDYYTQQARYDLLHLFHVRASMVVTADHNESSPDTIGLYGALETPLGVGVRSGIDEYYMRFLDYRIAQAAAAAVASLRPADLYANQVEGAIPDGTAGNRYPLLSGMSQRISDQFPTAVALPHDDRVAAVDTKMGLLQARTPSGTPIFTAVSLAAHNQEMGDSGPQISADWPGAMERAIDAAVPGTAIFLAGDNGSEEDPESTPTAIPNGSENHTNPQTQYIQSLATGQRAAQIAENAAGSGVRLAPGPVTLTRKQICIPVENNGFIALAAAGEFGRRQAWVCSGYDSGTPIRPLPNGSVLPTAGTDFRTFVSYAEVGPDLQLIDNPGEAFPALMLGSPFGQSDESCNRPNPAVPTWHADAAFRFQVGLADDMIGYMIPAWGFASGTPGLFNNDVCYQDMNGHGHKLESESAGPTSANDDRRHALAAALASARSERAHRPRTVRARERRLFAVADRRGRGAAGACGQQFGRSFRRPADRGSRHGRVRPATGQSARCVHGLRRPATGAPRPHDAGDHGVRLTRVRSRPLLPQRVPGSRHVAVPGSRGRRPHGPADARVPGALAGRRARASAGSSGGGRASGRGRAPLAGPYHPGGVALRRSTGCRLPRPERLAVVRRPARPLRRRPVARTRGDARRAGDHLGVRA